MLKNKITELYDQNSDTSLALLRKLSSLLENNDFKSQHFMSEKFDGIKFFMVRYIENILISLFSILVIFVGYLLYKRYKN